MEPGGEWRARGSAGHVAGNVGRRPGFHSA